MYWNLVVLPLEERQTTDCKVTGSILEQNISSLLPSTG